jgi:hypothetical protein
MNNRAFRQALGLLAHPVTIGAVALLLLNDHVLRRFWPSWWTGKIGDLAWLAFAPFVLAALLAWLVPSRSRHQVRLVGALAFCVTAGVFTLVKLVPYCHALTVRLAEMAFGFPVGWRRDPSDLIALSSLFLGWWLWNRRPSLPAYKAHKGWVILALAGLLTVANSLAPDYGVECVAVVNGQLLAGGIEFHISVDGGLSWEPKELMETGGCDWSASLEQNTLPDPRDPEVVYRFTPGDVIEKSVDGGRSWREDFQLAPPSEAEKALFLKTGYNPYFLPGPLDVVADPATGNIVLAMGHEGILVHRSEDDAWEWVPVGSYHRDQFKVDSLEDVLTLLVGEIIQAIGFGLLCAITLAARLRRSCILGVLAGIAWLLWAVPTLVFPHALRYGSYDLLLLYGLWFVESALIVPLGTVAVLLMVTKHGVPLRVVVLFIAINSALFLLPYVLWALGGLPNYGMTIVFAFVLGGVACIVEGWYLVERFPARQDADIEGS